MIMIIIMIMIMILVLVVSCVTAKDISLCPHRADLFFSSILILLAVRETASLADEQLLALRA
jgi:hypothetical protein